MYVAGSELVAFALGDGSVIWNYSPREALESDYGPTIGRDGPDVVRAWTDEYDLRVDRRTGRRLSLSRRGGQPPVGLTPFPAPAPTRFRIKLDLEDIVGYWPEGRVAWRLVVQRPFIDPLEAVEAGDAIVLVTSGQHIVVLEPAPA